MAENMRHGQGDVMLPHSNDRQPANRTSTPICLKQRVIVQYSIRLQIPRTSILHANNMIQYYKVCLVE
jgi:hypothetical protein